MRPVLGDGVPFEHVQRSSYVRVHWLFVRSSRSSDSLISPPSLTVAGTPTCVGVAHAIVAVSVAESPPQVGGGRVVRAPSIPERPLYAQSTDPLAGTVRPVLCPLPQSIVAPGIESVTLTPLTARLRRSRP